MALLMCSCGSGGTDSDVNKISKPNLTERDIRNYLGTYAELKEDKQKALRAGRRTSTPRSRTTRPSCSTESP